jgi:hypothetical protein
MSLQACNSRIVGPITPELTASLPTERSLKTATSIIKIETPTYIPTIENTKLPEPTPTGYPTLTINEMRLHINELLSNNSNCALPCLWGFVPGETNIKTVLSFLSYLGWPAEKFNIAKGEIFYSGKDVDNDLSLRLAFYEIDETLEGISFSFTHPLLSGRDQWLSISNILKIYGKPDQVWVSVNLGGEQSLESIKQAGFDVYLFYKNPFVLIQYHGVSLHEHGNFSICIRSADNPEFKGVSIVNSINVYSGSKHMTASPNGVIEPFGRFNGKFELDKAMNITIQDLYDRIIINQGIPCYSTPDNLWN